MMKKSILNIGKALSKADQQEVNGGIKPWCQGGGDPECCGTGPGQCGIGHCAGGILNNGVCVCF